MSQELALREIESRILSLPGRPKFMLAQDLATLYQCETNQIGQAVRRNPARFPEPDFCFHLSAGEWSNLKSQIVTSSWGGGRKRPLAFTRMGANMLSAVLKTRVAAARAVQIMRAFSELEEEAQADLPRDVFMRIGGHRQRLNRLEARIGALEQERADLQNEGVAPPPDRLVGKPVASDALSITITKDEYIELLKAQIVAMGNSPRRRIISQAEQEEIARLRAKGLSLSEIGRLVDRHKSVVTKHLKRVRMNEGGAT